MQLKNEQFGYVCSIALDRVVNILFLKDFREEDNT